MREIGTQKIGSHITNSNIKRPRVTVNQRIGSREGGFLPGTILRRFASAISIIPRLKNKSKIWEGGGEGRENKNGIDCNPKI